MRQIATISTAVVRQETEFTDTKQSPLSYKRAFEENYASRFVYILKTAIMEDMILSILFVVSCRAAYIPYNTVGQI